MGNKVSAAGPSNVPAPPMPGLPPPSASSAGPSSQAGSQQNETPTPPIQEPQETGPGSFEDLHKKCKDIFPIPFEGAKVLINVGLSSRFQIGHSFTMSSFQPSGYKFNCTYVGDKQYGPMEAYPIMVGEIDPSGSMNANIIHQFTKNIRCKFVSQIQEGKWLATQLSTELKGDDFQGSVTVANPDLFGGSGLIIAQYLQNVTSRMAIGTELLYQRGPRVPGNQMAIYTIAGRYTGDNWQASASITPAAGGIHGCYYHKINESLQMGVGIEGSLQSQECTANIGYQLELPSLTFRGQVDSNWCVAATLEKKLLPMPVTFALSAFADHTKGAYRFGLGMIV